jgi:hypothetical protein
MIDDDGGPLGPLFGEHGIDGGNRGAGAAE